MKWLKKLWVSLTASNLKDDLFAEEIRRSLGGLAERTQTFAEEVQSLGLEAQMAELRDRISALEKVLYPMRNGSPTH